VASIPHISQRYVATIVDKSNLKNDQLLSITYPRLSLSNMISQPARLFTETVLPGLFINGQTTVTTQVVLNFNMS
jgi:hypothetical protein